MLRFYRNVCGYSSFICLLIVLFTFAPALVTADEVRPSFNCKKAILPSEKAICEVPTLSKMDAQLGLAWTAMTSAFSTNNFKEMMRREQLNWLKAREACGGNIGCLTHEYEDRLKTLQGAPGGSFNGAWHADNGGDLFVYKSQTGEYLVAIHTSDIQAGAWTCNVEGKAFVEKGKMLVSSEGRVITIIRSSKGHLSIPPTDENFDSNEHFCGVNGGFTFDYKRVRPR